MAGASKEVDELAILASHLSVAGVDVLDTWMTHVIAARAKGMPDAAFASYEQRRFACGDLADLRRADLFWLLIPKERGSVGAWVELGHALALRHLEMVISGDLDRSIFVHACPRARLFGDHHDALRSIQSQART
jgi:hypothetical protein